ncbi:prefoldin, alpha subunit [Phytophthora nicotianae]|uniref:Prefoldin, alpha subunit n=2 Tax=Phytophthora nicotianae TaxID=4792 RepID=V9FMX4_PHYNI|nr:prefoldin, alpha subunit [Phytophthora nicotianae P1569]ETM52003.1 prefoldin, alpha subunit [Phytophthora nicotianae]
MSSTSESAAALQRYTAFVEEVLRPQLKQTLAHRDALAQEVQEYQELRELLQELAQNANNPDKSTLHTLLDVGERFHVRTKVPDTSLITVDIGLNFHVEMTVPEAQKFVQNHLIHLTEKRNEWQEKAREVSDHVNLVISSIQQLAALQ